MASIVLLLAVGTCAFLRLLWIAEDLPFLVPRTQEVLGFVIASPAILIAALWYPRLAMVLAGAILAPTAVLLLVLAVGDSTPELTQLCTGFPWSDIPAQQVRPGDVACFGGGFPETQPPRTVMVFGAASSGLALLFMALKWPDEAAGSGVAAATALGVVGLLYLVRYLAGPV